MPWGWLTLTWALFYTHYTSALILPAQWLYVVCLSRRRGRGGDLRYWDSVFVMVAMTVLLAPVAFYALIWPTHKRMYSAKQEKLDKLGKELHDCWESQATDAGIGAIDTTRVLALAELRSAIERDYPVWPFQRSLGAFLLRYLTTAIAPLLLSEFIPGIDLLFGLLVI